MERLDLYIDESGSAFVGDWRYRFFQIAGIIITPREKDLADLLLTKWRNKYLKDTNRTIHACDLFEEIKTKNGKQKSYKRNELYMKRNFKRAIDELIEIILTIDFESRIYYIDLKEFRNKFKIGQPPFPIKEEVSKKEAKAIRDNYNKHISIQTGNKRHLPLLICLNKLTLDHSSLLNEEACGSINMESQAELDVELIPFLHRFQDPAYKYGQQITGINLHTKASLDSGIEIADLLTYLTYQRLRTIHKLKGELQSIKKERLEIIRKTRNRIAKKHNLKSIDLTIEADRYINKKN